MEIMAVPPESEGLRPDPAVQYAILHDVLENITAGALEIEIAAAPRRVALTKRAAVLQFNLDRHHRSPQRCVMVG